MSGSSVSVVVPVYNGAATLAELVQRLEVVLTSRGAPFEILLVNDGSGDASWDEIRRLAAGRVAVRGIDLWRNYGQHNALLAGLRLARYAVTVTLDDDLQQPPEEIPKLLDALEDGADLVYGVPREVQQVWTRRVASTLLRSALATLLGWRVARYLSAFRAFRTSLRDAFADYRGAFVTLDALLTWGSARATHVTVEHAPRQRGRSNYSVGRLVLQAFDTVTTFSVRPLRFASLLGFLFMALGLAGMSYSLGFYKLRGLPVPGDTFLFAGICMFSGIQLFTLGILGEYLARMHVRLMDRPPYAIRADTARDA